MQNTTTLHERLKNNLILFGKAVLPTMFTVDSAPFHYEMADLFMDPTLRRLNIIAPRHHAKSSIAAAIWPLYHIFMEPGPKFIVLVSKTEGHSIRLLQTIKDALEYSPQLKRLFGYHGERVAKRWTRTEVVLDNGDYFLTRGTGQQVVGLKHGNQRPTLILLDDPEDMNNTKTAESMEFNLRWLLQGLVPSADAQRGRICVIGTPQHERCMVFMLKQMSGWKSVHYSAELDPEKKIALWPALWPWEKLQIERAGAASINRLSMYYREYLCQVLSDEDQLFKEEYFRWWEGDVQREDDAESYLHMTSPEQKVLPVNVFMGIDPSTSTLDAADYFAIIPTAVDKDNNRYVQNYVRRRMAPSKSIEEIRRQYQLWRPKRTNIETTQAQETFRDILRNMDDMYIPGLGVGHKPRDRKSKRYVELLEPYFFKRKVWLKRSMQSLVDELLMFPRGTHDDLIDALYYSFKGAYRPTHESPRVKSPMEEQYDRRMDDVKNSWWCT
jgi:predicted phage terminase large subunit-like protein